MSELNDVKVIESQKVITRFPPSPTGWIHIGNVRSNLYAWLAAKKTGGSVVLRIEDTDQKREIPGAVDFIKETLSSLGLNWDSYAIQSERREIYKKWADKLYQSGNAYSYNVTDEEVETWREDAKLKKRPFLFRDYITDDRVVPWEFGVNALRLKSIPKRYTWNDEVRGTITAGQEAIDDFIIMKSEGIPPYNFAHIIDDFEMGITHIFRSDEFISSTPKYLNLYEILDIARPKFVTCPPVMAPTGNKKLSKRDGAKPVNEYLKEGYLASGLVNFLALLGWNPGTTQEIFALEELIAQFDYKRIGSSGSRYDLARLDWINGHHIRAMELGQLLEFVNNNNEFKLGEPNFELPTSSLEEYQKAVLGLFQDRLKHLDELKAISWYFFERPELKYQNFKDDKQTSGLSKEEITKTLTEVIEKIEQCQSFESSKLEETIRALCGSQNLKPAQFFSVIRVALSTEEKTPKLFDIMEVIGKKETLLRLGASI
jgi:glutamyl-tRNA synthetase